MPRSVLAAIGIAAIGAFLLLLFWPTQSGQTPDQLAGPNTAIPDNTDWEDVTGDPRSGAALAASLCSRCHAVGPEGASPVGDAPPFRTFAQMWPLEYLDEALAEGIMVGHREHEMPVFQFDIQEIADLKAYLEELSKSPPESD